MRQDEAVITAYRAALSGIGAPVYTAIPTNAPDLYVFISDVSQSPETTTKTEFEFLFNIVIEIHGKGDAYNSTKKRVIDLQELIYTAIQPSPNSVIPMNDYYMIRQSLASTRTDEVLFSSSKVIRKMLIFDALISK